MSGEIPEADGMPAATEAAPDLAAVRQAQKDLDAAGKAAQKGIALLQNAAEDLRQTALFPEEPFEEGIVCTAEEMRKRYTAAQAEKLEWRRDACLLMLARQVPVEDIARVLRMNLRTITALAQLHGKTLATFSQEYADQMLKLAGAHIALADTKKGEASYLQLVTGAGILMTHAKEIRGTTAPADGQGAIDVNPVDEALEGARRFLQEKGKNEQNGTEINI